MVAAANVMPSHTFDISLIVELNTNNTSFVLLVANLPACLSLFLSIYLFLAITSKSGH